MALELNERRNRIFILASGVVGFASTVLSDRHIALWSLMPLLWLETRSRRSGFLVSFVFYLTIARGMVPGSYVFFRDGSLIRALALWLASAAVLAFPYGLLWFDPRDSKPLITKMMRITAAIGVSLPPPLGWIGWGSPLTAAGLFFPGTGWTGLLFMLLLYGAAACDRRVRFSLVIVVLLSVSFLDVVPGKTIQGLNVRGIDTSFGRLASGSGDFDEQYERERQVFQDIRKMQKNGGMEGVDVAVLPETLVGRMNPSVKKRWTRFFRSLEADTVFVVGAEIPTRGSDKYDNVMVSFGLDEEEKAVQRFPVPFSMYMPFKSIGANAVPYSIGESATMQVAGKKLGFLICYEQFLAWPFLSLALTQPDMVVAPSNLWWCNDTSLPPIQTASMRLWTALFGLPLVSAVNM